MGPSIEALDLRKSYGDTIAVDGLSFSVKPGAVTGFVGPNGAGKSTTMRLILGLDAPDEGHAFISGNTYAEIESPLRAVGALLDGMGLHPGRKARDHLLWLAQSNDLNSGRVDEVLRLVGLTGAARRRAGGFSLGMRQRLGIAAALLGDPPILMLDEPFNGLDPDGIRWMRGFLRSLVAEGRTVFVSSHLMSELEDTATHVVIIGQGRLIADASIDALLDAASVDAVTVRTPDTSAMTILLSEAGATVSSTGADSLMVIGLATERIAQLAAEDGLPVHHLSSRRASLEDVYLELTHGAVEYSSGDERQS